MRISDWSSDVCSSDLATASRLKTRTGMKSRRFNPPSEPSARYPAYFSGFACPHWRIVDARSLASAMRLLIYERSEEHTSELQSLMRISYAVFCLQKKKINYKMILQIICQHHLNV